MLFQEIELFKTIYRQFIIVTVHLKDEFRNIWSYKICLVNMMLA